MLNASDLQDGQHNLVVKAEFNYLIEQINAGRYNYTFAPINFTTDSTLPMIIIVTGSPEPSPSPIMVPTSTPNPTNTPSPSPSPTRPASTTVPAKTDNGATVELAISGNVTSAQMSNVTIATNQHDTSFTLGTVSFTVTGESGTTGFCNMTIPKSAIIQGTYGTSLEILIDRQPAQDQGYTQDTYNYYVWYTTHFSTHEILILFTAMPSTGITLLGLKIK